jgi:Protein of unknown function (DUF2804)
VLGLPHRGVFGEPRPVALDALALPPAPMPARQGLRPLKAWRYVGVFGPELMLCAASVRVGPARQTFWAVWDRASARLYERTTMGRGAVGFSRGRLRVDAGTVQIDLALTESSGIETVCPSGGSYAWTRKQGGVAARGTVVIDGLVRAVDARAVIDDTAAYYQRHTSWRWSAGIGAATDGRALAWNLVEGVNDPPAASERTVWVDGAPQEVGPCWFAPDLTSVVPSDTSGPGLAFTAEAMREHHENRLLIRSSYRQPFGTFAGRLPDGTALAEGYGVMEDHDVWW